MVEEVPEQVPAEAPAVDAEGAVEEAAQNAWEKVFDSIGDEEWIPDTPSTEPEAKEGEAPAAEATPATEAPAEGTPTPTPEAPVPTSEHFQLAGEGKVDWGEKTEIVFKADGRKHAVSSMDELVQLAQQGVRFDRGMNEFAVQRQAYETRINELSGKIDESEEVLAKTLWDEDFATELREKGELFRTEEGRTAMRAQRELEVSQQQQSADAQAQATQAQQQFWAGVQGESVKLAASDEYPNLGPEHSQLITGGLAASYRHAVEQLVPRMVASGVQAGMDEGKARQAAEQFVASRSLNAETLSAAAKALNDSLASQGPPTPPAGEPKPEDLEAEAAARNEATQRKLDEAQTARATVGGGAIPGGPVTPPPAPPEGEGNVFERRMQAMRDELQTAARPSSG